MILFHLWDETKRFSQLRRLMPEVSLRMLTKQLRELEAAPIISRTAYPEIPPRVEYKLNGLCKTLTPLLISLQRVG